MAVKCFRHYRSLSIRDSTGRVDKLRVRLNIEVRDCDPWQVRSDYHALQSPNANAFSGTDDHLKRAGWRGRLSSVTGKKDPDSTTRLARSLVTNLRRRMKIRKTAASRLGLASIGVAVAALDTHVDNDDNPANTVLYEE